MLVQALLDAKRRFPGRCAVSDASLALSYRRLTQIAGVFCRVIQRSTESERVGLMLPASSAFPAALFGTLWAGRVAVPLNFLLSPVELARIVADAGLDLILTVRPFQELVASVPARAVFLEDLPLKRMLVRSMILGSPKPASPPPDATAVLLYTSGTSAEPKGVELTHRNLQSNCAGAIETLEVDPRQTFLNILPPFHVFGLTGNVLIPVFLGASVTAIPRFNPLAVTGAVMEKKISVLMAIPSMYAAILRLKSAPEDAFRSIYIAVSGGEALPDSVRDGFQKRFGVLLRQGYGLTETSPVVAASSPSHYREGMVGRVLRNVEVRIVDTGGNALAAGGEGVIHVRGPSVMKGYFHKPEETRRVLDSNGWFDTGDIGRVDADGFLAITGRAKEMLIIGGENVFPREIEAVLESHEGVLQAAVIGISDSLRGEAAAAFVIPQKGISVSEEELCNFARRKLASFKVPRRIEIREDLPTGPTGKILKRKLRDLLS